MTDPPVSVILAVRNEEAMLPAALDSASSQDYGGPIEIIVADGSDTPATGQMIRRSFPHVMIISNPDRCTSAGLNRALRTATHAIIIRCDARARLPPHYVARAVETLDRTGAANVGGGQRPVGATPFERAVGLAMTTPLGAGDSRYRLGGPEGPVDTVWLGVFRREAIETAGSFDGTLLRNEDYELNWRLRQRGYTVWFTPALAADYRPRSNLAALVHQYFDYGRWKRVVLRRHPASWQYRHLAAPLLLAGLTLSGVLAAVAAAAELPAQRAGCLLAAGAVLPVSYVLALLAGSAAVGLRRRAAEAVMLPVVLAAMHLSWAAGFFLPPSRH